MFKKIFLRTTATLLVCFAILATAILCPSFMYANSTAVGTNLTVLHNQDIDPALIPILEESYELVKEAEIYNPAFKINVCLNDGSSYPDLIRMIKGEAFAYGLATNTVVAVDVFPEENYTILHGRKRILTEMFAHEFIHNYQYNTYGFSTLNFPFWKLEGYCEYVMTRSNPDADFKKGIQMLLDAETDKLEDWDWIDYQDGFGTTLIYLRSQLITQYLIEIKEMSYDDIIQDESLDEVNIKSDMINWFKSQNKNTKEQKD